MVDSLSEPLVEDDDDDDDDDDDEDPLAALDPELVSERVF